MAGLVVVNGSVIIMLCVVYGQYCNLFVVQTEASLSTLLCVAGNKFYVIIRIRSLRSVITVITVIKLVSE